MTNETKMIKNVKTKDGNNHQLQSNQKSKEKKTKKLTNNDIFIRIRNRF